MKRKLFFILLSLCLISSSFAQDRNAGPAGAPFGNILTPENGFDYIPKDMMKAFLVEEIAAAKKAWIERYEKIKTPEEVKVYADRHREMFRRQLGEFWDPTPLNPKITKRLENGTPGKDAYRVEMVLFESVPNFYVSGAVFLPDPTRFKPPYPAVLIVCGHSHTGKAYELYQRVPALAATHGLLAMSIDPIDQGERSQRLTPEGKPAAQGVAAHNLIGAGSILLGRNAATFELWDMMRAVDYLQSRPDVLPDKIGVTGTSGGGTQSSYLMALDERIAVAAPSCYLCGLFDLSVSYGPQDAEQNIFGQFAFGMDHADYCIMRAPKPTLIATSTTDFFPAEGAWSTYRYAKRIYDRFGYADQVSLIEHDGKHGWHKSMREAAVRWMLRWLAGRDEQVFESDEMKIFPVREFQATPEGEVMKIEGARSAFDLNRDYNDRLLALRKERNENRSPEEFAELVRKTTGSRPIVGIPPYIVESRKTTDPPPELARDASKVETILLNAEGGKIILPTLRFVPETEAQGAAIVLHEKGKSADLARIGRYLRGGFEVVAVDLRGLGETQAVCSAYYKHDMFGSDGTDYYLAYLLGKSYVGMRTEDLLAVARWIASEKQGVKPLIDASGDTVGVVALHAAVSEPSLFSKVVLGKPVRSWYDVVRAGASFYPITNLVHGALLEYDIPDLVRQAGAELE